MVAGPVADGLLELAVELAHRKAVASLHLLNGVIELLLELLGLDLALALLLVLLVDEFLLQGSPLVSLLLKPLLLRHYKLLLAHLQILLLLDCLHVGELFPESVRLRVLPLLN